MEKLINRYGPKFFARRHRLKWRAPIIADAIENLFGKIKMIDVGCGIADNVEELRARGFEAIGLEGSMAVLDHLAVGPEYMIFWDLREKLPFHRHPYELALCLEVAEHIEPEFAHVFVENLQTLAPRILMSAAPPGQKGHYHLNCQPPEYWEDLMRSGGYKRFPGVEDYWKTFLADVKHKKEVRSYHDNCLYFEERISND